MTNDHIETIALAIIALAILGSLIFCAIVAEEARLHEQKEAWRNKPIIDMWVDTQPQHQVSASDYLKTLP